MNPSFFFHSYIYIYIYIYYESTINIMLDEPDMQDTVGEAGTNS